VQTIYKRNVLIFCVGILLCVYVLCAAPGAVADEAAPSVKIGAVLALSGEFATFATEVVKGVELAVQEANAQGKNIELVVEDGGSLNPKITVSAAHRLLNIAKVDIGVTLIIEEAEPIAPVFNTAETPLVVLWDSNQRLRDMGAYIYGSGYVTEASGELMARFAYNKLGLRSVALIRHLTPAAEIFQASFKDVFESSGGKIVFEDEVSPGSQDFRTLIGRMKQAKPDGIYMALVPPDSVSFIKQLDEQGLKVPLLSPDMLIQEVIDASGPLLEGAYFTFIWSDKTDFLNELYLKKYGKPSTDTPMVSLGYDGLTNIIKAVDISRAKEIDLHSAMLEVFGQDRSLKRQQKLYQVKNGKSIEIPINS